MSIKAWVLFFSTVTLASGQSAWNTHTTQGLALEREGRYAEAARELSAAAEEADAAQLPVALDRLGVLYRQLGRYVDAESCHRRAISLLEAARSGRELATALENLAALRLMQSRPSQAQPLYRRAYELRMQSPGNDAPGVGETLHGMAQAAHGQHHYAEAEDLYRRASEAMLAEGGSSSTAGADVLHNWAALYRETGRDDLAGPLFERAAAIYENKWPLHPKLAIVLRNLAELEAHAGRYSRAQGLFERSLRICDASLPPDHPETGVILQAYGRFLKNSHRKAEAKVVMARASEILTRGMRATGGGYTIDVSEFRPR